MADSCDMFMEWKWNFKTWRRRQY